MTGFTEVADRVYVLRHPVLDVNATLVLGGTHALLVDTLSTDAQAGELAGSVRRLTGYPLILVNTHHHYDHCFGNAGLAGAGTPIWAHETAAARLREHGARYQRAAYEEWVARDPGFAAALAEVRLAPPDHPVRHVSTVDIGGRVVELRHEGRGHTDGDLVVRVPDADVLVAGDLVEESGPPDFTEAFPLEWPDTLAALLTRLTPETVVVPGHGAPVDRAFVQAQHADLSALDWLIRDGYADRADEAKLAARAPFGLAASLPAVRRGYAALTGDA
ncbi:MAG TPA: MBL fold metallo-hydrolase [Rugosimonospora sp.]|nr:MBL fold metallo-hydrolase [Rugosimonospora sp.]